MKKEKARALTVRIPESLANQLVQLAKEEVRSLNETVIYYVKQGIAIRHGLSRFEESPKAGPRT